VNKMGAAGASARSPMRGQGVGFRPKPRNRASVARFWTCRVKRRCGVTLGSGGCGLTTSRQRGGCAFANARPGGQDLSKKLETERSWLGFGRAVRNGSVG
jgi:hypothetical protein